MNQTLVFIALASANAGISMRVVEPMLPLLADEFSTSIPGAASIITAFAFAQAGAQYLHGPLGDRYGNLRVVTILLVLAAFASFGCAFAASLNSMMAWRFAMGFFSSGMMTLGMAFLADVVAPEERQPVIARFISGTIIGQALGPLVGGALADLIGWRANFVLIGAIFGLLAMVMFLRTRSQWTPGKSSSGALFSPLRYIELLEHARVRAVLASVFVEMVLFYGAFAFLGAHLKARFDLSFTLIGTLLAGFGVGGMIYIAVVRVVLARLGQRGCVLSGGIGSATCYALAVLAPVWPVVMACTVGLGFFFYLMHNTLQMKATEMAPHSRGTSISLFSMGWAGGQATGAALMGVCAATYGYAPMIIAFGCGLALLGVTLRWQLHRL